MNRLWYLVLIVVVIGCAAALAKNLRPRRVWVRDVSMKQQPAVRFSTGNGVAILSVTFVEDRSLLERVRQRLFPVTDDTDLNLDASVSMKWPLAVGTYTLDGRALANDSDRWNFRPGPRLSPVIESVVASFTCFCMSRPNWHADQELYGTLRVDEVSELSIRGNLELVSRGALDATVATDFEERWAPRPVETNSY
jgi:hypothetical protein